MPTPPAVDLVLTRPLAAGNEIFHDAIGAARTETKHHAPILVLLGDDLIVLHGGQRRILTASAESFHTSKAVSHMVVAVHVILAGAVDTDLEAAARARLIRLAASTENVAESIEDGPHGDDAKSAVRALLSGMREIIGPALADSRVGAHDLQRFATRSGPLLLKLTQHATREALQRLHALVEDALGGLDRATHQTLHVVVAGDHQARSRSLGMQYFQRRLEEPKGIEERVTYAENVKTVEEAIELVGTQRLDRAIARAFFGDENRLQRDVLGDAAKAILDELDFPPIA